MKATTQIRQLAGIYAILDDAGSAGTIALLEDVLAAGVRVVQYRAKQGIDRPLVRVLHARTSAAGAILIVNDDLDAALEANGLHLGQEDLARIDRRELRNRLGDRILGISCATPAEAACAESLGADYLGVGPFARTSSKADAGEPIGEGGVRTVVTATHLPVAAVGGIELGNLAAVIASGAKLAAVISAIARGSDPRQNARELVEQWNLLTR